MIQAMVDTPARVSTPSATREFEVLLLSLMMELVVCFSSDKTET